MSKCEDCKNYEPKKKTYKCSECGCRVFLEHNRGRNWCITCVGCGKSVYVELCDYSHRIKDYFFYNVIRSVIFFCE